MNSKQLNFFLTPADLPLVYEFFNRLELKYIRVIPDHPGDISLEKFPFIHGEPWQQLYLTIEDFRTHLFLQNRTVSSGYALDENKSYVLQLTPGGFHPGNSKVLNRGRFWCPTSYFVSNGESVAKPKEFKSWVDKIFRLFKKEFLTPAADPKWIYFSHNTLQWMADTEATIDEACLKISLP